MAEGAGRYDHILTEAREAAKATGAILMIYGGEFGDGFEAQMPRELRDRIPSVLRQLADHIEQE